MILRQIEYGSTLYDAARVCREIVLRVPLGLTLSDEDTAGEDQQIHIVALEDDSVYGTVTLKPLFANRMKLRQMAVAPEKQGRGIGQSLVRAAEKIAADRGCVVIEMHARLSARVFYERLGYHATGAVFIEVTQPHIRMEKEIP